MCSELSRVSVEQIMVNASPFCRKTETKTVMTYLKRPAYFHPGNKHAIKDLAPLQPGNGHDLQGLASLQPYIGHALKSLASLQPGDGHLKSISSFHPRSNTAVFHPGS